MLLDMILLARRVRALRFFDEIRLIGNVLWYLIFKRNKEFEMDVVSDGVFYRILDLESLFIISPRYEQVISRILNLKKDECFIDIGSHIGKYSLRIAKETGAKVIAIEPDPDNHRSLVRGIELNNLTNTFPLHLVAYDCESVVSFYVAKPYGSEFSHANSGKGWSSLVKRKDTECISMKAKKIDTIVKELDLHRVDWMKIDAEEAEYQILQGSKMVLSKFRPQLIVEITQNKDAILEYMRGLNYQVCRISEFYFLFIPL